MTHGVERKKKKRGPNPGLKGRDLCREEERCRISTKKLDSTGKKDDEKERRGPQLLNEASTRENRLLGKG